MTNLNERLDKHLQSIREAKEVNDFISFLKSVKEYGAKDMAEEILNSIKDGDYRVYYGDDATSTDAYYIAKSAFEDTGFNNKYIKGISKEISRGLKNAGSILKHPGGLFSKEEIEDGTLQREVDKQAKQYNCKPEDVVINIEGHDDSYDYLRMCQMWPEDMISLLKKINTKTAKQYIQAIQNDPILKKALNMCIFDY